MKYIVVFVTASSAKEAEKIASGIISAKLAACVNIVPNVKSIFTWKGKKESCKEALLIIKTKKDKFARLKEKVKKLHSYDTPEIISIPIQDGYKPYLDWIDEVTE
jgi:periplasmic divalent cation tolerance protein